MKFFADARNFSRSLLDKSHERHEISLTLLGGLLYFSALGGIATWGNLNLYYFSYFKNKANLASPAQMNLVLPLIAVPIALISVFSIQIAEKIGFRRVLVSAGVVYGLSTLLSALTDNLYVFTLLYNLLPGLALAFSMNPAIYCVWHCYPTIKGRISGYMFATFQLSTLFYNLIATLVVNPGNKPANEQVSDGNNNVYNYYGSDVSDNVCKMVLVLSLIYLFLGVSGCLLIKPVTNNREDDNTGSEIEMNNSPGNKYEEGAQNSVISESNECPDVKTGIKTRTFMILFLNSGLVAALALYLNINFKTFSLTRLNNDYYVTCLYILNAVSGGIGRLFWGYIVDKYSFKSVIIGLEVMVFLNGIIFPFATGVFSYSFMVLMMAFFDGGLISIIGPGLMGIYGLNVGAKLLPVKALSFFVGLMLCPIVGILLESRVGIDNVFLVLGAMNIIGVVLAFFIKTKYNWYKEPKSETINT